MKTLILVAAGCWTASCWAATSVPVPHGNVTNAFDARPFLIPSPLTIRYQQVFSSSAFRGVPSSDLYLSRMTIFSTLCGIALGQVQINISTTQRGVDQLNASFAENAGPDDTVVFGPGKCVILGNGQWPPGFELIFQRPFIYKPDAGNLLLDVRVFEGNPGCPGGVSDLTGQNVLNDEVSRVYADDVTAFSATHIDSGGFSTVLWFYPIPSLSLYTHVTGGTNYFFIEWPTCPTVFRLQRSGSLGPGATWVIVPGATNNPTASFQRYWFPVGSVPPGFYRLYWNGQ